MSSLAKRGALSKQDGVVRLIGIAFRKFCVEPGQRESSARLLLSSALHLYAMETSAREAAATALDVLTEAARMENPE